MPNTRSRDFIDETQSSLTDKKPTRRKRAATSANTTSEIAKVQRVSSKHQVPQSSKKLTQSVESVNSSVDNSPKSSGTYIKNDSAQGNEMMVLSCPICLEELSSKLKPTSTKCGHIFCRDCLALAVKKLKKCPTCQISLRMQSCIRLYF